MNDIILNSIKSYHLDHQITMSFDDQITITHSIYYVNEMSNESKVIVDHFFTNWFILQNNVNGSVIFH